MTREITTTENQRQLRIKLSLSHYGNNVMIVVFVKKKKIEGATPVAATTSGIEGASLEKMRGAEMKKKHKPFIVRVIPALYKIIKNIQFHLEKMMRIGRIFQVGNPLLRLILRVTMLLETVKPLSTTLSKF